jgi:NAD(P)-dependent dehydrogenase (short-subunit alcohol dehydrogenase family)
MLILVFIALVLYIIYLLYKHFFPARNIDPRGKYVLISGCDTGFGHSLAIELDNQGFHVLAGVYNVHNKQTLTSQLSSRATVFVLDITCQQDIDAVFALVKSKTSSLHGLINNAGIANGGLIDWVSLASIRQVMEVNFFGHVAMIKTFLPLLLTEPNSRVVNMSSAAGYLAAAGASAYSTSKYALEAFSDCLRREMAVWDLHVSIIEPGFMRTPIIDGMAEKMGALWIDHIDNKTKERWGETYFSEWLTQGTKMATQTADDPMKVVRAVCHAVTSSKPHLRYRPGWQSSLVCFPLSMAPAWLVDLFIGLGQRKMALPSGVLMRSKHRALSNDSN